MIDISVRSNIRAIEKSLSRLAYKQVPFATAKALSAIGKRAQDAEIKNLQSVLDRPTPFTLKSVGVKPARKDSPQAIVFVKDIAADYLEPYEFGGTNKLNSQALLKPVDAKLNQYGNLPRNLLARYRGRKDVFIGEGKGKNGTINGVWQRIPAAKGRGRGLKLLVVFANAHQVTQHLGYMNLARKTVAASFKAEFGKALAQAIATAKG